MHTFTSKEFPDYLAHHNGDWSGDVIIHGPHGKVSLPNGLLRGIVAEQIRDTRIRALESATADELLGGYQNVPQ